MIINSFRSRRKCRRLCLFFIERKSLIMELDSLNDQIDKHEQFMKGLLKLLKSSSNIS